MKSTLDYVNLLRRYFEEVARQEGVTKMALFGSVARGEQNEDSDVDVAYEGSPNLFLSICLLSRCYSWALTVIRICSWRLPQSVFDLCMTNSAYIHY